MSQQARQRTTRRGTVAHLEGVRVVVLTFKRFGGSFELIEEGAVLCVCVCTSHSIQFTPHQQSAEPIIRAGAEALSVAIRPKEASREKTRPPPVSRGSSPWKVFFLTRVLLLLLSSVARSVTPTSSASTLDVQIVTFI